MQAVGDKVNIVWTNNQSAWEKFIKYLIEKRKEESEAKSEKIYNKVTKLERKKFFIGDLL